MSKFISDTNDVWVDTLLTNKNIDYPHNGNENSLLLEANSFWFMHRNNIIREVISRFPFTDNFADIGGGNGLQSAFLSKIFEEHNFYLIEPGYNGCLNARRRGVQNVYNTISDNFPFVEKQIGGVGLFDVVEHIKDDVEFLSKLYDTTSPDILLYITVPAYNFLWSDVDDYGGHYRRYNLNMLKQLANNSGFEMKFGSYFFSYLPVLTFLLRSLPYKIRGKRNENKLLETENQQHSNRLFSSVIEPINKFELSHLKNNKVNFGASCIAVFTKNKI